MKHRYFCPMLALALFVPAPQMLAHGGHEGVFGHAGEAPASVIVFDAGKQAIGLRAEPVNRGIVRHIIHVTGNVQAATNGTIEVRPSGDVMQVLVNPGDRIKTGTPLAMVRSPTEMGTLLSELIRDRQAIEQEIEETNARLSQEIDPLAIVVANSKMDYERQKRLAAHNATADQTLQAARTKYESENSKLALLKQQLQDKLRLLAASLKSKTGSARSKALAMGLSEADFSRALEREQAIAEIEFLSPVSGVVSTITGEPLDSQKKTFTIVDPDAVWVVLDVFEDQFTNVQVGQEVTVHVASNHELPGVVFSKGTVIDPVSRTFPVRIAVDNHEHQLNPGMSVTDAQITLKKTAAEALNVAVSALVELDGKTIVYRQLADNRFEPVTVSVGLRNASVVEITSGLDAQDIVVAEGAWQLYAQSRLNAQGPIIRHGHSSEHDGGFYPIGLAVLAGAMTAVAAVLGVIWRRRRK